MESLENTIAQVVVLVVIVGIVTLLLNLKTYFKLAKIYFYGYKLRKARQELKIFNERVAFIALEKFHESNGMPSEFDLEYESEKFNLTDERKLELEIRVLELIDKIDNTN